MSVVAIVPARDRADSVGSTVTALLGLTDVDRVIVVDDASTDATSEIALAAGATVVKLPTNLGKGGAVGAGLEAAPDADVILLIDADVGADAAAASTLLAPVLRAEADMTIGVLPSADGKGGFGLVRDLARRGIRRASGFEAEAPLSGQRAIRAELLRGIALASRFGLETALTIDAVRAGARVLEVPVVMDHRHTGRRLAGFAHRGRQGRDIIRALWPRLTSRTQRLAALAIAVVAFVAFALGSGAGWEAPSSALGSPPAKVVVFGIPHVGLEDLQTGLTPVIDGLIERGSLGAMSVRTLSGRPATAEAYASLGAGTRIRSRDAAGHAFTASETYAGSDAGDAAAALTGERSGGAIFVPGIAPTIRLNTGKHISSEAGALGEALAKAGLRTGVVGNADNPGSLDDRIPPISRPAAIALSDRSGSVVAGDVSRDLLLAAPAEPFGHRADPDRVLAATQRTLAGADVVFVDPGDLDRAHEFARLALATPAKAARAAALVRTDELLGRLVAQLPPRTLLIVAAVSPPAGGWHVTPVVVTGPGVPGGWVHSPSTKRQGIMTITDLAPTILAALDAPVPSGMIGHALRYSEGQSSLGRLRDVDRDARFREGIYFPITLAYIIIQALLYLTTLFALSRIGGLRGPAPRPVRTALRVALLMIAAFPLATFLLRAIPDVAVVGPIGGVVVLLAIDALAVALAWRARAHHLAPLAWLTGTTVAVIVLDVATGARLQTSSMLGYSLHTAARFFGIGNTAFAVLAACAILTAAVHVHFAPRRREAVWAACAFLAVVALVDAAPSLGDDVGGILTLVPVFALTGIALAGRRLSFRTVATVAVAAVAVVAAATAVDLLRPPDARTHLGRFAADVFGDGGGDAFMTTVSRKLATNAHVLGASVWTWMVPIIAVFMLILLVVDNRITELLPPRSALRTGAVATLAAGLLGFAVNDSGVVVTALVFVYLGPYLGLLALQSENGRVEVLSPSP